MKKRATLILALALATMVNAQITITQNDMPNPSDTFRISTGLFSQNPASTGANFVWDYSSLQAQSQRVDTFLSWTSVPWTYQLFYLLVADKPTIALNITTPPFAIPGMQMTISDVLQFYRETSSYFGRVGFGAAINGIEVPVQYSDPEKLYQFPLNFQGNFNSYSEYNLNIPTLGYFGQQITRNSVVDGWGTLKLPCGQFPVLRVKATLSKTDSIYYSAQGFGISIPEPPTTEYLWVTNGIRTPLLVVTSNGFTNSADFFDPIMPDTSSNSFGLLPLSETEYFPNPASGSFSLRIDPAATPPFDLSFTDMTGRLVLSRTLSQNQAEVPLEGIQPGIYHFRVRNPQGQFFGKLILR